MWARVSRLIFTTRQSVLLKWFARVVRKKYPNQLHVVYLDSAKTHTAMAEGAAWPSKINKSEGGKNRVQDNLFGMHGLDWIFANKYPDDIVQGLNLKELRARLWEKQEMKSQSLLLESILAKEGHLMIFNVIAHSFFSMIEYLWRDMKYDYKTKWETSMSELQICIASWLDNVQSPLDGDFAQSYHNSAMSYIEYYMCGGTAKLTERKIKLARKSQFTTILDNPTQVLASKMANFYREVPGLPRTMREFEDITIPELRNRLQPVMHELNWMRIKRGAVEPEYEEDDEDVAGDD